MLGTPEGTDCIACVTRRTDGPVCIAEQANTAGRSSTVYLAGQTDGPVCIAGQADTAGRVITQLTLDRKKIQGKLVLLSHYVKVNHISNSTSTRTLGPPPPGEFRACTGRSIMVALDWLQLPRVVAFPAMTRDLNPFFLDSDRRVKLSFAPIGSMLEGILPFLHSADLLQLSSRDVERVVRH